MNKISILPQAKSKERRRKTIKFEGNDWTIEQILNYDKDETEWLKISEIGKEFFDNNWIHAKPNPNKASGAFSHPTVTDVHPFILLNYFGTSRAVSYTHLTLPTKRIV